MANKIIKRAAFGLMLLLVLLIGTFCYFFVPNPLKTTNPYSQSFNPESFRIRDYENQCMVKEALAKIFPVGTDKDFVDRILLKSDKVEMLQNKNSSSEEDGYSYTYTYIPPLPERIFLYPSGLSIVVVYDNSDQVKKILIPGGKSESVYEFLESCKIGKHYGRNWK